MEWLPNGPIAKYCELKKCTPEEFAERVRADKPNETSVWAVEQMVHELGNIHEELFQLRKDTERHSDTAEHKF